MLFTSIIYFLFLGSSLLLYYLLPSRYRKYSLIIISALFYTYAKPSYLVLIAFIIFINFIAGNQIERSKHRNHKSVFFYLSLFINLGILVFFKYWNFLIENLFHLVELLGIKDTNTPPFLDIVLPIGLSYYIFQIIGYNLDINRGTIKSETNIFDFSLFVLFFPKLTVGPIERAGHFLPQLKKRIFFRQENIVEGGKRIVWGVFKKLVVADRISIYHDAVMSTVEQQSGVTILFASVLYTFQVYADFSGYTDIAIGTARMFGYDLMENFKRPLLARNVGDFWRRWHISLSSWVNDYIFNPIAFKRRDWGNIGVFYALIVSFVVIGIWHGASWNYVLFGLVQALALIYETLTRKARKKIGKKINPVLYRDISIVLTFTFVTFSLIIFQSPTFSDALSVLKGLFLNRGTFFFDDPPQLMFMLIACVVIILSDIQQEFGILKFSFCSNRNWLIQQIAFLLLLGYILIAGVFDGGEFIYFAF